MGHACSCVCMPANCCTTLAMYVFSSSAAFADVTLPTCDLSTYARHKHVDKLCTTANSRAKPLFYKTASELPIF